MERNMSFPLGVKHVFGKMTWAQVEIVSGAQEEVQLLVSGDDDSVQELRVECEGDTLTVSQPQLAFAKEILPRTRWLQVFVRLPKRFLGELDIDTVSGMILASGITGDGIKLSTISGGLHARHVEAAALHLHTVSGGVAASGIVAPSLRVRAVSGGVALGETSFSTAKITSISGEISLAVQEGAKTLELQSVAGQMTVAVRGPASATLKSLTGQLSIQSGVMPAEGGLAISAASVTAGLTVCAPDVSIQQ